MPELKPFTKYVCPDDTGQLGHSSIWTGAYNVERTKRPTDGVCICGAEMVDEASTADGHRYRLVFESIDPHEAAEYEALRGKAVWPALTAEQWERLSWHEVSKEDDVPGAITSQYERLRLWAETHEQPIRSVQLFKSEARSWQAVDG